MKRDVRDIRKQFRLTEAEEKQILALMRERGETNFSDFLRKVYFPLIYKNRWRHGLPSGNPKN